MNTRYAVQYWSDMLHMWVDLNNEPWKDCEEADLDCYAWQQIHPEIIWRVIETTDRTM